MVAGEGRVKEEEEARGTLNFSVGCIDYICEFIVHDVFF
jgi:hypothetical protein